MKNTCFFRLWLLLFSLILLFSKDNLLAQGQKENKVVAHYIVLVDESMPARYSSSVDDFLKNGLIGNMGNLGIKDGDFVSIIPFGFYSDNKNFRKQFDLKKSLLFKKYNAAVINIFLNKARISSDAVYSGKSVAMQRSIFLFSNIDDKSFIFNTYIILLSSGTKSNLQPMDEINALADKYIIGKDKAIEELKLFDEKFDLELLKEGRHQDLMVNISKLLPKGIKVLDINSVALISDLKNEKLEVSRNGGNIKLNFAYKSKSPLFKIQKVDVELKSKQDKDIAEKSITFKNDVESSKGNFVDFPIDGNVSNYVLVADYNIIYLDSIYNRQLISSNESAGLKKTYSLVYETESKVLFIIPMPEVLYTISSFLGIESPEVAVVFCNIIFFLMVLITVVLILIRYIKRNRINSNAENILIK